MIWVYLLLLLAVVFVSFLTGAAWADRRALASLPSIGVSVNEVPPPSQELYDADRRSLPAAKTRPTRVSSGSYETTRQNPGSSTRDPRRWN